MKTNRFFLLALLLLIFGYSYSQNDFLKVEPPFWWTRMQSPSLQIMVYGQDAGEYKPVINYKGVKIDSVVRPENDHYMFIYLSISSNARPGSFTIDFQKDGASAEKYKYHLFSRKEGSAERKGFNTSDVIYLITPDRFANGDATNDNIPGYPDEVDRSDRDGRHGGDISGITGHLDYIRDMGFTAIWINPLLENKQPRYSYHGYSITDFYKTDPRHGSNEDYRKLVDEAHKSSIKVIMDMIFNHCGSGHWWMKDLPSADWINYGGEFVMTNHRRAAIQDPYRSEEDLRRMSDGWFVETMPDLNQRNRLLADYLIYNSIWWIEYADLDGIRVDTYPYPDMDFMAEWTCRIMDEYPQFNITGEEWTVNPALVAHWQRGKVNPNGYISCLPSLLDFPLQSALVKALNHEENPWFTGWIELYEMLANDFLYADPFNMVTFADNHDMSRIYTQVGEDPALFRNGIAWLLTIRGIPQIYYGTEILMTNPGTDAHGVIRSDFPGGWEGDAINAFTGEGLTQEQVENRDFLKKLLNWRKGNPVVQSGKLMQFAPEDGVYVFFRYSDDGKVMTILHKSDKERVLSLERFSEMLEDVSRGYDVISGKEYHLEESIILTPGFPLVLELK
ncbi:MAG: glycoside hydrolase family 13 protein [Bacteroidetes bacterium]|nr:glycoside hydrolase family 13 protein [Bacteroidota bacterium]